MKRMLLTVAICAVASLGFAQVKKTTTTVTTTTTVVDNDTTVSKKDTTTTTYTHSRGSFKISFGDRQKRRDSLKAAAERRERFNFGLKFRFDLGLTTLIDNGSFTLSPANEFLSYRSWKSSNVGFELVELGYRFGNNFKMSVGAGFDWTLLRLRENITIQKNTPTLTYVVDNINYSKNRFSSTYLRVPVNFEFRTNENADGKRFRWIVGPEAGLLLGGRVKQISEEKGKQKMDDDYHFTKLRYGAFTRLSYGFAGIYAKYYISDMFENSPAQAGLKNFAVGLNFTF